MSTWLTPDPADPHSALELSRLRAQFKLLFEHNPAVVMAIDAEDRIVDVNAAGLRISGYAMEDLRGHDVTDFVPPTQRDRLRQFLRQAAAGETATFSIDAYSAAGRLIEYEATTLPIVHDHRIVGVYGLLQNVTERLRAERTVAAQREELMDLEHDFKSLFEHNPDGVGLLSVEGEVLEVNDAVVRIAGRPHDEIVGQNFRVFLQGQDLERAWRGFLQALEGDAVTYEVTSTRGDGGELHLETTLFPKFAQGFVVGIYFAIRDVTEQRITLRKLEAQAQRMRDLYLLATTPEYTDAQFMSTLQTGCRLLGVESGAIVELGDTPRIEMRYDSLEIFGGDDGALIDLARSIAGGREGVASSVADPGGPYATWIGSRLMTGGPQCVLTFFSRAKHDQPFEEVDFDTVALIGALVGSSLERKRSRTHLRALAYNDSLTGLPNRLFFLERLRDALTDKEGRPKDHVAVLFFDLDRFKDINDTLGHAMGDRFLQMVAHRLARSIGDGGLVARMGGDEFIVLLRDARDRSEVEAIAAGLLAAIEEPFRMEQYEQFISTSIGIACFPNDGRDDQTLVKHADMALYRMKDRGGSGYLFYEASFETPLHTRLVQEKHLRTAIENEQFVLHYQPIIDVRTGRIVTVETLVRWNHPQRGLVSPDEFIPTAEASGLIIPLGEWVFEQACRQVREWQRLVPLRLAVNISARQFHHPRLCDRLLELVQSVGFNMADVEIEITESMALADVSQSIETVRQLKRLGAQIAVDDFGTGHSSLSYLQRFEIDHLKIDRSFVAGISGERSDEAIVKAIIGMGRSLGMTVVAEGVETDQQYAFLRAHDCDRVQGYLFSRPLEPDRLERLLRNWRGNAHEAG
jgi:diguanylate cyclase (GGDEF)-like protein/PAS domain S-box-containing protein